MRWLFLLAVFTAPVLAELPAPNAAGVSFGQIQLRVRDANAQMKVWTDVLAPQLGKAGPMVLLKVPGINVIISNSETDAGSDGSALNHITFAVKDYADIKTKLKKDKVPMKDSNRHLMATFPAGIRVEFIEDKNLPTPVAFHHLQLAVVDPEGERDWYVKHFGAVALPDQANFAVSLPGGEIHFVKTATPQAPTRGRALDHFGLEVKGLEAFCKNLTSDGVTLNFEYHELPRFGFKAAFLTDPAGAYIELTEGLAGK
ncbi:MAG TPA: VOC family protein [Bryobacteraceae bacterium]|nr:VOC family protein [Bryobacteraceae bacterium]